MSTPTPCGCWVRRSSNSSAPRFFPSPPAHPRRATTGRERSFWEPRCAAATPIRPMPTPRPTSSAARSRAASSWIFSAPTASPTTSRPPTTSGPAPPGTGSFRTGSSSPRCMESSSTIPFRTSLSAGPWAPGSATRLSTPPRSVGRFQAARPTSTPSSTMCWRVNRTPKAQAP